MSKYGKTKGDTRLIKPRDPNFLKAVGRAAGPMRDKRTKRTALRVELTEIEDDQDYDKCRWCPDNREGDGCTDPDLCER